MKGLKIICVLLVFIGTSSFGQVRETPDEINMEELQKRMKEVMEGADFEAMREAMMNFYQQMDARFMGGTDEVEEEGNAWYLSGARESGKTDNPKNDPDWQAFIKSLSNRMDRIADVAEKALRTAEENQALLNQLINRIEKGDLDRSDPAVVTGGDAVIEKKEISGQKSQPNIREAYHPARSSGVAIDPVSTPFDVKDQEAVANLHKILHLFLQEKVFISNDAIREENQRALEREQASQTFGSIIKGLIITFQTYFYLKPTGQIDRQTAKEINSNLRQLGVLD